MLGEVEGRKPETILTSNPETKTKGAIDSETDIRTESSNRKRIPASKKGKKPVRPDSFKAFMARASRVGTEPPSKPPKETRRMEGASMKRDRSMVPDGGFFRAMADKSSNRKQRTFDTPLSDDHSSEDSTSDSSEVSSNSSASLTSDSSLSKRRKRKSDKQRKQSRTNRRKIKKALSGVKIATPFIWDGRPDLDSFDRWTYAVTTWCELNGLEDRLALKVVVNCQDTLVLKIRRV